MERMILHYARLAQEENVALFGLGLELKHSVRAFPDRWRVIIAKGRKIYRGRITYSANWYDEWQDVAGTRWPGDRRTIRRRWQPIVANLERVAKNHKRPVFFTEVGYTGYVDCAGRPWEWAGKKDKGVAIDHAAQARAHAA